MREHWYTAWWLFPIWCVLFGFVGGVLFGCAQDTWRAYRSIVANRRSLR